jgi:KDO2-lipid IV(A) lauroyltransferase
MNHGFAPVFQKTSIGIRKMIKHIKDKNHVFMLTDQRLGSGEAVNFFGQPAMTTPSAAELAIKYNMALIPIFTVRKSIGNYEIHLQPPMNLLTEIENPKVRIRNIIQKMNDVIEAHIRQFPNDWFWLHRRWK